MKQKGKHKNNILSALGVSKQNKQGFYPDGNGLYLKVDKNCSKRWIQRITINGKRRDIGLGGAAVVGLADARIKAMENKLCVIGGGDPIEIKQKEMIQVPSFSEASYIVWEIHKPTWKNKKHANQWIKTLEIYAFKLIGDKSISNIDSNDILGVLVKIWTEKPETANRVRQRIGVVIKWAIAKGYRNDNPVTSIEQALPKRSNKVTHHKSLPYVEVPAAMVAIENSNKMLVTKRAFEFLVITNLRSEVARTALWADVKGDMWDIPAETMKNEKGHRVPLSSRCMEILEEMKQYKDGSGLVFSNAGDRLSDVTFSGMMIDLQIDCVPHGFRSSFKTWATEQTAYPQQIIEFAMHHVVGDKAERAYQRSDVYEKRRGLMQEWSDFVRGLSG